MRSTRRSTLKTLPKAAVLSVGLALTCLQAESFAQQTAPQAVSAQSPSSAGAPPSASGSRQLIDRYCVTCHNERLETAGLRLDQIDVANVAEGAEVWEKVVRKLRTGTMPPSTRPQPSAGDRGALVSWLETSLDQAAAAHPNPGRTETLRRLNRTEYQNSIRDLLALDIDATALLPSDDSGYGFDNVNVGDLSPALLDRYMSAAQKISRLAVGSTQTSLQSEIIRVPPADWYAWRVVCLVHLRAGRRVRHSDTTRAQSYREHRGPEAPGPAHGAVAPRPDAGRDVHGRAARRGRRCARR